MLIGGGQNHRMGLFDMVLIKDNHISIAGGVTGALRSVDSYLDHNNLQMGVEVPQQIFSVFLRYQNLWLNILAIKDPRMLDYAVKWVRYWLLKTEILLYR